jgi:hypothetical protein
MTLQYILHETQRVKLCWQWPLSGVHSIMMVNSAQPGEGGGCTPSPFRSIYHHALGERAYRYTPPISPLPFSPLWYEQIKSKVCFICDLGTYLLSQKCKYVLLINKQFASNAVDISHVRNHSSSRKQKRRSQ